MVVKVEPPEGKKRLLLLMTGKLTTRTSRGSLGENFWSRGMSFVRACR